MEKGDASAPETDDRLATVNWKTDLSGGIQRVAIAHGMCAVWQRQGAVCVVWTFPDPVPLHRGTALHTTL